MLAARVTLISVGFVLSLAACMGSPTTVPDPRGGDGGSEGGDGDDGSGRGGGDGGGDPPPSLTALFVASDAERMAYDSTFLPAVIATASNSVMRGVTTDFSTLPTTGSMTYAGFLEIVVGSSVAYANVAAPASITLTLLDNGIIGEATGFMGSALDENLEERLVNYAGTILITGGQVSDGPLGNAAVSLDIDGSIDSGLHVFNVDGTLIGSLYGLNGEGLRARASTTSIDGDFSATVDGTPALIGSGTLSALVSPTTP